LIRTSRLAKEEALLNTNTVIFANPYSICRRFSTVKCSGVAGMPSKPVELATRSFENQGDAKTYFKTLLNRYRPGERVSDTDSLDLAALLERHTEYAAKVGCGVSHFQVILTEHGTQCFRIIRTDGTGTDFSYINCITQRPPPAASKKLLKLFDVSLGLIYTRLATTFLLLIRALTVWFHVQQLANVFRGIRRIWIIDHQ
jgi:hypothetical protein